VSADARPQHSLLVHKTAEESSPVVGCAQIKG